MSGRSIADKDQGHVAGSWLGRCLTLFLMLLALIYFVYRARFEIPSWYGSILGTSLTWSQPPSAGMEFFGTWFLLAMLSSLIASSFLLTRRKEGALHRLAMANYWTMALLGTPLWLFQNMVVVLAVGLASTFLMFSTVAAAVGAKRRSAPYDSASWWPLLRVLSWLALALGLLDFLNMFLLGGS